MTRTQLLNCSM